MKALNNYIPAILIAGALVFFAVFSIFQAYKSQTFAGVFPSQGNTVPTSASSTAYSLTWGATATQILATSTASTTDPTVGGRVALELQTHHCAAGGLVYLNFGDKVAATGTVQYVLASSTLVFGDTLPMVHGSIRAMASNANCTLLVTEFRSGNF